MGEVTGISWTDHTFNPWEGCTRVSDGCLHCYAEARAHRFQHDVWGKTRPRMWRSDSNWAQPLKWNRQAEADGIPRRVFCASLADVFEAVPKSRPMVDPHGTLDSSRNVVDERHRLFELIEVTPWLRWQLLTKRPENVLGMTPIRWAGAWPTNVWIGTTVEHQAAADARIPELQRIPAAVRFLSCEPLLGPVNFGWPAPNPAIDWVIIGGESGGGYRAMDLDHARQLAAQCKAFEIPAWFKQVGGNVRINGVAGGDHLDGAVLHEHPRSYAREIGVRA